MTAPMGSANTDDPRTPWIPLYVAVAALVLGRFGGPLGRWVGSIGTAAHEAGHAATADLLAGRVLGITVFRDGGGVTLSQASDSDLRSFIVSASGYSATLVVALALLSGVVFARSSQRVAWVAAAMTWVSLLLWVSWSSQVPGISDGDQHFTWILYFVTGALLFGVSFLPSDTYRRVVLGVLSVGLLTDAFRAGKELVLIEGRGLRVATDADSMAESAGVLSSSGWAWAMRLGLFAVGALWAALAFTRWSAGVQRRHPA